MAVESAVMLCVDKQLMLGVGDLGGTLHILEVPWSLRHPSSHEVLPCVATSCINKVMYIIISLKGMKYVCEHVI